MTLTQSVGLLLLLILPSFSVARKGGGSSIGVEVEVAFQFAEPIDISVFAFCVIFAVFMLIQSYSLATRLLCAPVPDSRKAEEGTDQAPAVTTPPTEDHNPGPLFTALITLASLCLLAYWILLAVFQALVTSSENIRDFGFPRAFYACLDWIRQFAETLILASLLLLLHRRAEVYTPCPPHVKRVWKLALDGGLLVWALVAQVVSAALYGSWKNDRTFQEALAHFSLYINARFAYAASDLALTLDVLITSLLLWNFLAKSRLVDPTIRTILRGVVPMFLIVAFFQLALPTVNDIDAHRRVNIDYAALDLSDVLIYGLSMLVIMLLLPGIGHPAAKPKEDEERQPGSGSH